MEKNELPDMSLVSMCPINLRDPNNAAQEGNVISSMSVALRTEISSAKSRLHAICEETRNAKELTNAVDAKSMAEGADFTQMNLAYEGARVAAEQGWANFTQPMHNTIITNVPGPQVPLYSSGARQIRTWGTGPALDGNGLFQMVSSYCGEVTIGITSCRDMMPDPANYADCLDQSFAELKKAFLAKGKKARRTSSPKKKVAPARKAVKPVKAKQSASVTLDSSRRSGKA